MQLSQKEKKQQQLEIYKVHDNFMKKLKEEDERIAREEAERKKKEDEEEIERLRQPNMEIIDEKTEDEN